MIEKITRYLNILNGIKGIIKQGPVIEQNIVIDNEYLLDNEFNKPRKYDNIYHYVHNRTIISNKSSHDLIINEAHLHVSNVKKYDFEDVVLNFGLFEQDFFIYSINNGNLKSKENLINVESYAHTKGGLQKKIKSFEISYTLESGEIKCLFEEDLEKEMRYLFYSEPDYMGLFYKIIDNHGNENQPMIFNFDRDTGLFNLPGMGGGGYIAGKNVVELNVDKPQENYVFNNLGLKIAPQKSKEVDIIILPGESIQLDYWIEYKYKGEQIKNTTKCAETAVVKLPHYNLHPNIKIQFMGEVFWFLVNNGVKNYCKGNSEYVDMAIGLTTERIKGRLVEINDIGS